MTLSTITRQPTCNECGCRIYDANHRDVEAFEACMCPECHGSHAACCRCDKVYLKTEMQHPYRDQPELACEWCCQVMGETEDRAKFELYWEGVGA